MTGQITRQMMVDMERKPKSIKPRQGWVRTTNGTLYAFERICVVVNKTHQVLFLGVELEPHVSASLNIEWEYIQAVELVGPDVLLNIPEHFHLNDTKLIIDGEDGAKHVRATTLDGVTIYQAGRNR